MAEADTVTLEGLALAQPRSVTIYLAAVRARLVGLRGDAAEAAERLATLEGLALDSDVASFVGQVRAEVALADGRPADAALAVADGLSQLEGMDEVLWVMPPVALGLRAAADGAKGSEDVLRARLGPLAERAATGGSRAWVALAKGEATRLDGESDSTVWSGARDVLDALADPFMAAYARLRLAEAQPSAGGGPDLVAAHRTARSLGAEPLRRAIEAVAASAGVDLGSAEKTPAAAAPVAAASAPSVKLSGREKELLALIAQGLSNGQIADRLAITRKAAAVRVTQVLRTLGVSSRAEAAAVATRLGLVERPESASKPSDS